MECNHNPDDCCKREPSWEKARDAEGAKTFKSETLRLKDCGMTGLWIR